MKNNYTHSWKFWTCCILAFIQISTEAYASHAQGADLTYRCLGGNQYEVSLAFYRDCSGSPAPGSVSINVTSASCNQNFNATLFPIPGTGVDVTPICSSMTTVCNNGNQPGVQEWIYRGTINLPQACTDWTFSFSLCCRNNAISTINNPGGQNIYVESLLNNVNAPCNSSPTFSNRPIPFVCVGQNYCFNHGATDLDGDSLVYALLPPATGPNTFVSYIPPFSAAQPVASNPAMTFNTATGDICMTPTQLLVTVMAVRVEEWRNGILIGSVVRDIQLHTISCTNNLPYVDGINSTNTYSLTACAGSTINFNINSFDIDPGQNLTMTWNNAILGATFTTTNAPHPVATFNWTPTAANISNNPYCFTVTVSDDNCPFSGSQTYAFCILVTGFGLTITSTGTNCGASNGSASVVPIGGNAPYTYQWSPSGGNNASANGLPAGNYTVTVTDASGCVSTATTIVTQGPANANLQTTWNDIACFGGNTGNATVNANGGQQPYTYAWSNGGNTPTISNLVAGTYSVVVTTANGCTTTAFVTITQPASALTTNANVTMGIACFGGSSGVATVTAVGGIGPYVYSWNTNPAQTTATATQLAAATYSCVVTDAAGCTSLSSVTLTQPNALTATAISTAVSCNGGTNGSAIVNAAGGTGNYTYVWNTLPAQFTANAVGLGAGAYSCQVSDANGCSTQAAVVIIQPAPLSASLTNLVAVSCNGGNNGLATMTPTGGTAPYGYSWNTVPAQFNATATNLSAGSFTCTVTDANGCATIGTATILQPTAVVLSVSADDTVCPGQPVLISASALGGAGNYSYVWLPNLGNNSSYTVYPAGPTYYSVQATDANGCVSAMDSIFIDVFQFSPANLTVTGNTSICEGMPVSIAANVVGNTGPLVWTWSVPAWNGAGPHQVFPVVTTTYQVSVTNVCGVVVQGSATVVVHPLPQVVIAPVSAVACDEARVIFADNDPANIGSTYVWDFGDNTTGVGASTTHDYLQSGNYTVNIIITSPFGCVNTAITYATIQVHASPTASFTRSVSETSILEPTIAFVDQSVGAIGWNWDFGDSATSTQVSPTHTYAAIGTYQVRLVATALGGCTDTTELPITVNPEVTLYVPNAFTPNGDGKNDVFMAVGEEITEFQMTLYDRWGQLIFQSNSMQEGWDGKARGGSDTAQQDVYVWKITAVDFGGKKHQLTGHVSLLR
jgi:gliding motility-associated-like protein